MIFFFPRCHKQDNITYIHILLVNHFHSFFFPSPADSEKSLSPPVDNTQSFNVPFWNPCMDKSVSTAHPPLVQQQYLLKTSLANRTFYCSPVIEPQSRSHHLFSVEHRLLKKTEEVVVCGGDDERCRRTQCCTDATALLFRDGGRPQTPRLQASTRLLSPSLVLSVTYKCIKCSKVRTNGKDGWKKGCTQMNVYTIHFCVAARYRIVHCRCAPKEKKM